MASRSELYEMVKRQQHKCAATGMELMPNDVSLDHMIPVSRGGSNDIENLHMVHNEINRAKGSLTWAEFVSLCHAVAAMHGNTAEAWWKAQERRLEFLGSSE